MLITTYVLDAKAAASNSFGRNLKTEDKKVTERLKENIEMLNISNEIENDDNAPNDDVAPKNEEEVQLDFEVVLCPDFNFKDDQDKLVIASGDPLSNFDEPLVRLEVVKRLEADYIHFRGSTKLPKNFAGTYIIFW